MLLKYWRIKINKNGDAHLHTSYTDTYTIYKEKSENSHCESNCCLFYFSSLLFLAAELAKKTKRKSPSAMIIEFDRVANKQISISLVMLCETCQTGPTYEMRFVHLNGSLSSLNCQNKRKKNHFLSNQSKYIPSH